MERHHRQSHRQSHHRSIIDISLILQFPPLLLKSTEYFSAGRSCSVLIMDTVDLHPLLKHLEGNIDDLEEALAPLLNAPLSDVASKLPLLDKAKLHVMSTYAIESILFCTFHRHSRRIRYSNNVPSIPSIEWRERKRTCRLHRAHPPQAVLRKDQESRGRPTQERSQPRQASRRKVHQACLGTAETSEYLHVQYLRRYSLEMRDMTSSALSDRSGRRPTHTSNSTGSPSALSKKRHQKGERLVQ